MKNQAHPGKILLNHFLTPNKISQRALSRATGLSRSRISALIKGRLDITPDIAVQLGAAVGPGADFWLGLQGDHDAREARRNA